MPRINLLPWREEQRQKRKKEFLVAVLGAVVAGAALVLGTKMFYRGLIDNQNQLNGMLRTEIAELDKQIAEIEGFEAQRDRLLDRMEIIEQLQLSRPEAVHLLDELVNVLPPGTNLTELTQQNRNLNVTGNAQSLQRVGNMMRNVEQSEWLRGAQLEIIENTGSGPLAEVQFRLRIQQVPMSDEEAL